MKRVALSAGHHPSSPGACHDGRCEHETASNWVSMIAQELHGRASVTTVPTGKLQNKIAFVNDSDCDLAIEVHFNACGDCGAHGAETLYFPGSTSGEFAANIIHGYLMDAYDGRDRGIKEGWYRMDPKNGPDAWLVRTNCTALIIEPEFIEQYSRIQSQQREICAAIADGIVEVLRD